MDSQNRIFSLNEIRSQVEELGRIINVPDWLLPTFGHVLDGSRPAVLVDDFEYRIVLMEHGQKSITLETRDLDELLYHIFFDICFSLGFRYEQVHRVEGLDFRRVGHSKSIDFISQLNAEWGKKMQNSFAKTLRKTPYDDLAHARVKYDVQLRSDGIPEEQIEAMINEKYPRPKAAS